MSLKIIRAGILDTVQDGGRYGHQHLGINPGGAMDRFSASLANALLGKELNKPVIEMHFPAPQILFEKPALVCLAGADFTPLLNRNRIPVHQPVIVSENSILQFGKMYSGARCYLSVWQQLHIDKWMNSYSTNLKAGAGGYKGRRLLKEDVLEFEGKSLFPAADKIAETLPWRNNPAIRSSNEISFIPGPEWDWLSTKAQAAFLNNEFIMTRTSDRMGCRLASEALEPEQEEQLVSSAVNSGTVQLLPDGQLIVLMADHQTTGGYPRVAQVISADLTQLAQLNAGAPLRFVMTNIANAEKEFITQQQYLTNLKNTCNLKMQNWFNGH